MEDESTNKAATTKPAVKLSDNERAGLEALHAAGRSGTQVLVRGPVSGATIRSLRTKGLVETEMLNPRVRWATILPEGSAAIGREHRRGRFVYLIPDEGNPIAERGYRAATVREGEGGYRWTGTWPYEGKPGQTMPYFWGDTREAAEARCAEMNAQLGVDQDQANIIIAKSMQRGVAEGRR